MTNVVDQTIAADDARERCTAMASYADDAAMTIGRSATTALAVQISAGQINVAPQALVE